MSQSDFGNLSSPLSGTDFFNNKLEPWRDALHSCHKGTSRPSYAVQGMMWIKDTTTPWILNIFDGSDDIALGTINASTNIFTPAGSGVTWGGTAGGSANALTLSPSYALTNTAGQAIRAIINADNTNQTVTLAVSGQAALPVKKNGPTGLVSLSIGDLVAGHAADFLTDGTNWILLNTNSHARGADVASASTVDLTGATGDYVQITGTTTVTAFTMKRGQIVKIVAAGDFTLTNGSDLLCPGAKNIAVKTGDSFTALADTSSTVRIVDYLRKSGAPLRLNSEVTIASAATTDLGAALGNIAQITGTTTITSFGSNADVDNPLYFIRFTGALTLTHNGTSLILPSAANITTAAGDTAIAKYEGSGNWRIIDYQKANGQPIAGASGGGKAYAEYTGNAVITTSMPSGSVAPAITDGTQVVSITYTPKSATNKIRLSASGLGYYAGGVSDRIVAAIFNGNTFVNADLQYIANGLQSRTFSVVGEFVAGTTSPVTYSLRVGGGGANYTLNNAFGNNLYSGAQKITLMLEEYTP